MKKISMSFSNHPFLKLFLIIASLVFAASFIPVAGSIILIFFPMILFLNGMIYDRNKTAAAFLVSFLILFLLAAFMHLNLPVIAIFTMGMTGLFIAQITAQNGSIEKIIIYPALFIIAAISLYFIYSGFVLRVNPWQLVEKYITAIIEENVKLYSQLPLKAEDINFVKDNKKNIIDGIIKIFPAMVVITSALIVWANFLTGKRILAKAGITWPKFNALARWQAPDFIIWIFIVSGGLLFVSNNDVIFFSVNIFLITCFIYLLQGLAILSFLFQNKNIPLFFRYFFYFLIAVQQILMIPVMAVGLFDIWVDFRKFIQKDQTQA